MVSKYSKYYGTDKYDPTRLVCLTCNVSMKKAPRNATSGLRRHLATHHKEQYIELTKIDELKAVVMTEEAQKNLQLCKDVMMEEAQRTLAMCQESVGEQLNLDSICSQWSATESEEPCQLNKAVLRCIVEEGLPVSFLDSAAAQDLLSLATNGQYNLPSSSHFTALEIPEAYEKLKRVILNAIKECPSVSLTVRGLPKKDRSSPSLLGVSAHWLTDDFERKNAFIGTFSVAAYVEGSADFVERSLNDFDIPRVKVRCLTRTVEDVIHPEFSAHNVPCFDQMLHQCAGMLQCNIDNWRFTFFHLQDICKFLQESKLAKEDYIICLQLADLCNFPSKGSSDSWESTYQLCERFLDAKSVVEHLLVKYTNLPKLTDKDWKNIEMAKKLMKPFCDASKVTHYSDSAPISVIIPFVRVLLMGFEVNKKDSPDSQRLFNQMTSAVSPYLKMEELQIAAVLDPRFKLNFLLDEDTAPVKEKILKHAAALACKGKQNTPLGLGLHQVKSEPDPHFGWAAPGTRNVYGYGDIPEPSTIASSEVEPYLSEKWNMNKGPLVYWQQNKHRFPILTQLVREYLCSPPNTSDTERLLSPAKVFLSTTNSETLPDTLEKLLFLKVNSTLFPAHYNTDFNIF